MWKSIAKNIGETNFQIKVKIKKHLIFRFSGEFYNCEPSFGNTSDSRKIKAHLNFPVNPKIVRNIEFHDLSLKRFPPGIGESTPKLEVFKSVNGNIEFINRSTFKRMINLCGLYLWNQKISSLPDDVFWDLTELKDLDLSYNQIETLPTYIFLNNLHLQHVNFDNNKLIFLLKDVFANNLKMESVWFRNNKLKKIEIDFTRLPNIKVIEVSGNNCYHKVSSWLAFLDFSSIFNFNCINKPKN